MIDSPPLRVTTGPGQFSKWCFSRAKRCLDLVCASVVLLLAWPIILVAAVLIRLTSPGPVLFRHTRVGKDGRSISVLKLRTMTYQSVSGQPDVTRGCDPRITRLGRLLRRLKIDELPQLINVLRGEMSMVGPRPDMAKYLEKVSAEERGVLLLPPGITSSTTLKFRNEEMLLAAVPEDEVERVYCVEILPQKIRLELDYARRATFTSDVAVLFRTAAAIMVRQNTAQPCRIRGYR